MIDLFLRRQLFHAFTPDRSLYFPYVRGAFLRSMMRWHREATTDGRYQMADISTNYTIILQSYKRAWNIEPMVRMFLRFDCVGKVIVSNNNPAADIRYQISDIRLNVINQAQRYPASMFAMIALGEAKKGASHFLCIDDDLLLFPAQIETLMRSLIAEPSVPHGLVGQSGEQFHVTGNDAVDILNRAYAFTADHIRRYAELLDRLGYATDEEKAQLPFGSDIVLSHSGKGKPQIHDVGLLLSCPTAAKPGIARFKDEGFEEFRADLWKKVQSVLRQAQDDRR